jgi:hypothetical protein
VAEPLWLRDEHRSSTKPPSSTWQQGMSLAKRTRSNLSVIDGTLMSLFCYCLACLARKAQISVIYEWRNFGASQSLPTMQGLLPNLNPQHVHHSLSAPRFSSFHLLQYFISFSSSWVNIGQPGRVGICFCEPYFAAPCRWTVRSEPQSAVLSSYILQYRRAVHSRALVTKFQVHVHSPVFPLADSGSTGSQCPQQRSRNTTRQAAHRETAVQSAMSLRSALASARRVAVPPHQSRPQIHPLPQHLKRGEPGSYT